MPTGFLNKKLLRLLLEILLIVGAAETAVMFILPLVAPGASETLSAVLDAGFLTLIAAPLLLWRFMRMAGTTGQESDLKIPALRARAIAWPFATLVLGAAISAGTAYVVHQDIRRDGKSRFDLQVDRLHHDVSFHFEQPTHAMNSMVGFYNASHSVERREFDAFWEFRDILLEYPGVRSFGFIQPVLRTELARFVEAEKADGFPDFAVKSTGDEPELFVVRHMVSTIGNRTATGIDMNAEPVRRAAMHSAIDSGKPTLSGMVLLVPQNEVRKPGFIYMQPVYRSGADPQTPAQRRKVLRGVVYAAIVLEEIMAQTVTAMQGLTDFEIFDGARPETDPLIFDSVRALSFAADANNTPRVPDHEFESTHILEIGGHTLSLRAYSTPAFEATLDRTRPALLGGVGMLLTLFLSVGIWLLIQGRALAERRARQMSAENERLATVVQLTNNSVVIADAKGDIEWVNAAFTRISGFTLEQAIGRNASDLRGTQTTDPAAFAMVRHAVSAGQNIRVQTHNTAPNGQDYWLDEDIQILRDKKGHPTGYVAVETDITAERRSSETLEAALMETAALMDTVNIHSIVSEANRAGDIINVNYAFERISGYSREELIGSSHRIVNSGVHPYSFWVDMWATISGGEPWRGQVCNRAKDGTLYWVDSVIAPFKDAQGEILKYVSIRTDITAAKHYQTTLQEARDVAEEATRAKGQFLANMSHEIRTPMNAILGMLSLLQKTDLSTRQADYASKTEGAARSLLGLLNDILDFSKVEAGKMALDLQPFRLDRLLRDVSVVLSANVGAKNIEVLFDIDPAVPAVLLGDALRLQQVLINLGGNAVKFTAQGEVVIAICPALGDDAEDTLTFSVKDSGIGIAPENQQHIFSGFSQAEASTSRRFGGTGLGLAISQRLVDVMGGQLQLASVLGEGSTFSFTVKLPAVEDVPQELQVQPRPSIEPRRVLVVEDNPVAGELMLNMTHSWGWDAVLATSGEQALELIHQQPAGDVFPFQVVYLDWHMPPGMDGWETARQIRQLSRAVGGPPPALIMVTGQGRETLSQRTQAEQDLLNGFLVKPVTASMLLDAVVDVQAARSGLRHTARGASQRRLNGMRLLVVEDNLINQQVAEELLVSEGAWVSLAANGQLGVDAVLAAQPQFDAVLMDVQMPVLDGYAATRVLRGYPALADLPIVAMTANAMASDRQVCLDAGMTDHVGKPFDLNQLVALLLRLTGHAGAGDSIPTVPGDPGASKWPDTPGVELEQALSRIGGMQSLYLRSARDFVRQLPLTVAAFDAALRVDDLKQAAMHMHTAKGNAGTLGLHALAELTGALEKWCAKPEGHAADEAQTEPLVSSLESVVQSSLVDLQHAIAVLEEALAHDTSATPAAAAALGTPDAAALRSALTELETLLANSDLTALERFADLRPVFSGLPQAQLEALEEALQNLELEQAHALCVAALQLL